MHNEELLDHSFSFSSHASVDDVPDEGLDVPLRLEKMANEVTYQRLKAALSVRCE